VPNDYKSSIMDDSFSVKNTTASSAPENAIAIVENIPEQTSVEEDRSLKSEDPNIPAYMAPKTIEVRRYILRK